MRLHSIKCRRLIFSQNFRLQIYDVTERSITSEAILILWIVYRRCPCIEAAVPGPATTELHLKGQLHWSEHMENRSRDAT